MGSNQNVLEKMVSNALSGKGAHVDVNRAFAGLDWKLAGTQPEGLPHSVFQLLNHMSFWNRWVVKWLGGEHPPVPKHAPGGWPGKPSPASADEWKQAIRCFSQEIQQMTRRARDLDLLVKQGTKTRLEMLQAVASHNSYHLGQVVVLRQRLGAWPPPGGGLTW